SDVAERAVGLTMRAFFGSARIFGRKRASRFSGGMARIFGPFSGENRIAAANLARALPEPPEAERRAILSQAWDHLGRMTAEYAFFDDIVDTFDPDRPTGGLVEHVGIEHAFALRDKGVPGVIFGAHLGNWELTAAIGAKIGL